jgi:hypothetical protein
VGYNSCHGLSFMAVILGANNCFFRCDALLNCNSDIFFFMMNKVCRIPDVICLTSQNLTASIFVLALAGYYFNQVAVNDGAKMILVDIPQ